MSMSLAMRIATLAASPAFKLLSDSATRNYNFYVEFDGLPASFSKISGLENSMEMQPYREGGNNSGSFYLTSAINGDHTLRLEYGVVLGNVGLDSLVPGTYLHADMLIVVLGHSFIGAVPRVFLVEDCYVKSVQYGELDAQKSGIMINNIEIGYRRALPIEEY